MSLFRLLLLAACVWTFFGCARSTLTLEEGDRQLAPVLGASAEELIYVNHAVFAVVEDASEAKKRAKTGLVALNSSELILAEGSPASISASEVTRIPFSEMEGHGMAAPFVQVLYEDKQVFILPYRWYIDTLDGERLLGLSNLLTTQSVGYVESEVPENIEWPHRVIHLAEGGGAHFLGKARNRERYHWQDYPGSDSSFYNGNEVRDSPGFQPFER